MPTLHISTALASIERSCHTFSPNSTSSAPVVTFGGKFLTRSKLVTFLGFVFATVLRGRLEYTVSRTPRLPHSSTRFVQTSAPVAPGTVREARSASIATLSKANSVREASVVSVGFTVSSESSSKRTRAAHALFFDGTFDSAIETRPGTARRDSREPLIRCLELRQDTGTRLQAHCSGYSYRLAAQAQGLRPFARSKTLARFARSLSRATPRKKFRDDPQRVGEVTGLDALNEIEYVRGRAAAKAVEKFFFRMDAKTRVTFLVERTQADELPTRSAKPCVGAARIHRSSGIR